MGILTFLSHMPLQEKKGPDIFTLEEERVELVWVGHQDLQRYIHS